MIAGTCRALFHTTLEDSESVFLQLVSLKKSRGAARGVGAPPFDELRASRALSRDAFAYDNVFLIDGVDVNDNLLGTANDLFIEEAISEVQVLSSAISAEYGRFSGGVINIITRSGGNLFAGSHRTTFSNPAWSKETPRERVAGTRRPDILSTFHEMTVGGPAVTDRLWFFCESRRTSVFRSAGMALLILRRWSATTPARRSVSWQTAWR